MFIWRKVGPARSVILPSKKGDSASRVSLQAEPAFCISFKRVQKDLLKQTVFLVEDRQFVINRYAERAVG